MRAYWQTLRTFNRDARLLLVSHFLIGLSYSGIYVVLFNLYLLRLDYGTEFIGLINGIAIMLHAFFCLPAGILGGRWGTRRTVVIGALIAGVGLLLAPLGEFIPQSWQAIWFTSTYTLAWLGASFYLVNHTPFLISVTAPGARNHVFSLLTALLGTATFLGSLLGGALPGFFGVLLQIPADQSAVYRASLVVGGVIFLLAVPVLLQTRASTIEQRVAPSTAVAVNAYTGIALFAFGALLRVASEGAGKSFFTVYLNTILQLPTATIGLLVAVGQLLAIPAALLMPLLVGRWGRERTIGLATAGMALSLIPMALIAHWLVAALSYMTLIALAAIARPAFLVYSQESVPAGWRATMSGAVTMANGVSMGGMAIGGGYLIAGLGYTTLFGLGATLTAAGAFFFAVFLTGASRRLHPATPS